MIHSFTCKNFFSLGDEASLSFVVNNNAPKNSAYFTTPSGARLSKAEVVIGPNASGKTNLLKVLAFIKFLVVDSFNIPAEAPIAVLPFMLNSHKDKATELSVVFELSAGVYTYNFSLNKTRIISEDLSLTSKVVEKKSTKQIFSRTWNEGKKQYDFDGEKFELPKESKNLLRANTSVIAVFSRLNHKESKEIYSFWEKVEANVGAFGWIGGNYKVPQALHLVESLNFFSNNDSLKKEAEKLLSRFDLGLEGFTLKKQDNGSGAMNLNVQMIHSFDGEKVPLSLDYQSSGTKQLLTLLKHVLSVLDSGGIIILDELDASLHPEISQQIFKLFTNPDGNEKNAQILFSTHNHQILNSLDKYQIYLTEKNAQGCTEVWRLDEVEGVRPDDNYYAKYIAGAYGAVPQV